MTHFAYSSMDCFSPHSIVCLCEPFFDPDNFVLLTSEPYDESGWCMEHLDNVVDNHDVKDNWFRTMGLTVIHELAHVPQLNSLAGRREL
jgi:hypothetical protein